MMPSPTGQLCIDIPDSSVILCVLLLALLHGLIITIRVGSLREYTDYFADECPRVPNFAAFLVINWTMLQALTTLAENASTDDGK